MDTYNFYITDYYAQASHLNIVEDLVYRRLLDLCYATEKELPSDPSECASLIRMDEHCKEVSDILHEFFHKTETGWISRRAEKEISSMRKAKKRNPRRKS